MDSDKPTILVADDDRLIRAMIADLLTREFNVLTAADGKQAMEMLDSHQVACVLSDQMMPGATGVDVLEKALAEQPHAVRILITATDNVKELSDAVNRARVHRFVVKPVREVELPAIVKGAVRENQLELENQRLLKALKEAVVELQQREQELENELRIRTQELKDVMQQLMQK